MSSPVTRTRPSRAISIARYPGPGATSSTSAPSGRSLVSSIACLRYSSIWLPERRTFAYQRATAPSISGPLNRHRRSAACMTISFSLTLLGSLSGDSTPNSVRIANRMTRDDPEKSQGLSRARLVSAALGLVQQEGLEALTMRGLADQLNVKAASLYWHVRDRRELLELLADSILASVRGTRFGGWRSVVLSTASALATGVAAQRDAARILLEVPEAINRSGPYLNLIRSLQVAGLPPSEA